MSPLETPAFVGLLLAASVVATVLVIVTERYYTVRRNRRHAERGYVR